MFGILDFLCKNLEQHFVNVIWTLPKMKTNIDWAYANTVTLWQNFILFQLFKRVEKAGLFLDC